MSDFLTRAAVAVVGLLVVVGVVIYGGWLLFAVAALVALLALHEFYRLARPLRPLVLAGYAGALAALLGAQLEEPLWMIGGFLATFVLAFLFAAISETRQSTTVAIGATVLGAAWIGLGLSCLLLIRGPEDNALQAIFTVLLTVFANDTFAYLGGHLAGRHKMTPVMSPGKTWEGFVVGAAAGIFTAWISRYDTSFVEGWRTFVLGGAVVLAATIGDLFESLVKRDLGAKDTGRLLPGHGGMLDRIDSLLFAGPAGYFTLLGLGQI